MEKTNRDVKDEYDFSQLKMDLDKEFDLDKIMVSEDLIQRTMKSIENGEKPRISEFIQKEKRRNETNKKQVIRYIKRIGSVAAVLVLFVFCAKALGENGFLGGSEKSSDFSESMMEPEKDTAYSDSAADNSVATQEKSEEAPTAAETTMDKGTTTDGMEEQKESNFINILPGQVKEVSVTKAENTETVVYFTDRAVIESYVELMTKTEMTYEQVDLGAWNYKIKLKFEEVENYYEVYVCEELLYVIIRENDVEQIMSYRMADYTAFMQELERITDLGDKNEK